jgi:hypothetical protein
MEWKTIAEDSAKKAKTQRRRQEIPSLSAMTQLDVDLLWFGVTRKSGNEHTLADTELCSVFWDNRTRHMKVDGTHDAMMRNGVMLGVVVGAIAFSFVPIVLELALGVAILEPKITHVH